MFLYQRSLQKNLGEKEEKGRREDEWSAGNFPRALSLRLSRQMWELAATVKSNHQWKCVCMRVACFLKTDGVGFQT